VYRHINQLENGGSVPQTELLSYEEQQQVLAELKSIMAVYGSNCRI
jgi:DNA-directed RNA polymerase subunit H (RpoH/RPB5)